MARRPEPEGTVEVEVSRVWVEGWQKGQGWGRAIGWVWMLKVDEGGKGMGWRGGWKVGRWG